MAWWFRAASPDHGTRVSASSLQTAASMGVQDTPGGTAGRPSTTADGHHPAGIRLGAAEEGLPLDQRWTDFRLPLQTADSLPAH